MNKEDLRPIGTEFDCVFPPSETTSQSVFTRFRYRVVGHDQVGPHPDNTRWAERIEPIDSTEIPATRFIQFNNQLMPVPPEEWASLLDDYWSAVLEKARRSNAAI